MSERRVFFEVILPDELKAVSQSELISGDKLSLLGASEAIMLSGFQKKGEWCSDQNPKDFYIFGVRFILARKPVPSLPVECPIKPEEPAL